MFNRLDKWGVVGKNSHLYLMGCKLSSDFIGAEGGKMFFLGLCEKLSAAFGGRMLFLNRRVFHDFAKQNHEKHVGLKL